MHHVTAETHNTMASTVLCLLFQKNVSSIATFCRAFRTVKYRFE